MNPPKVLFITTSHDILGDTNHRTGVWLEELAAPYYVFKDAGADIMLTSPKGGRVPVDPKSQSIIVATSHTRRFLKDPEAMNFLAHSMLLDEINANDFDMVFIAGGHASMWDIADNNTVKQLLEAFNNKNNLIGAVCHGVAGLLSLQNERGELLLKDKQVTGFSNNEEESAGMTGIVPFLLETRLISLGAMYSKGPAYTTHVADDGNIITGQNPASVGERGEKNDRIAQVEYSQINIQGPAILVITYLLSLLQSARLSSQRLFIKFPFTDSLPAWKNIFF